MLQVLFFLRKHNQHVKEIKYFLMICWLKNKQVMRTSHQEWQRTAHKFTHLS